MYDPITKLSSDLIIFSSLLQFNFISVVGPGGPKCRYFTLLHYFTATLFL